MSSEELESTLIEHQRLVDSEVEELDAESRYLFGVSCFERLVPVHERASNEKGATAVRLAMERLWSWLGGEDAFDWSELRRGVVQYAEIGEDVVSPEQVASFLSPMRSEIFLEPSRRVIRSTHNTQPLET